MTPDRAPLLGRTLEGGYHVASVIGEGEGGGIVYVAKDGAGTRHVLRCPRVASDATPEELDAAFARFDREARELAALGAESSDVEQLVAHGVDVLPGGRRVPWSLFAWLEGEPLDTWAATHPGPRSIGEVLAILDPVFRALSAAHRRGVVHRNVRPGSVWIAYAGGRTTVKLTGFALASHLDRDGREGPPFVPAYGAPEHFKKAYGAFSPATDVYGLALLLVELVAGTRALVGTDPVDLYMSTSDLAKRPTFRARGAQVSDALEAVVARALAVDPRRRWTDAPTFLEALRGAIPELTPAAPSVRPPDAKTPTKAPPTPTKAPPADAPSRRPLALRVLWGVATMAFMGGLGLAASRMLLPRTGAAVPSPASARTDAAAAPAAPASAPPPDAAAAASDAAATADDGVVGLRAFPTDMLRVPAGTFVMGTDREGKGDGPSHSVILTHPFFIDRTEVTTLAYAACLARGACTPVGVHAGDVVESTYGCNTDKERPQHPVNCVDRAQAERYCTFAGKRLPTEAEWEYAARGKDQRGYPWGEDAPTTCEQAVLPAMTGACGERKGTAEVAATPLGKSPFGAFDMAGNVWEWVADGYEPYPTNEVVDPKVPLRAGARGILRGGSWDYSPSSAKTTYRLPFQPSSGNVSIGFRCAKDAGD